MSGLPERIIWVNGLPRSGTSWLCQIIDSSEEVVFRMAPLYSFQYRDSVNIADGPGKWKEFFESVYRSTDPWMSQLDRRSKGAFPTFENKQGSPPFLAVKDVRHHNYIPRLLELDQDFRILHIIRDPRAAIHSWLTNPKEFPKEADPLLNWRSGKVRKINENEFWGFEDWIRLTKQYEGLKMKYPDRVTIVRYEELVMDPLDGTKAIFESLGLCFMDQTKEFVVKSTSGSSEDPFSVYKNSEVVNKWRGHLQVEISTIIEEELRDTELNKYLFEE